MVSPRPSYAQTRDGSEGWLLCYQSICGPPLPSAQVSHSAPQHSLSVRSTAQAPTGFTGELPSVMLLVSTLTRLRLLASNSPLECVPIQSQQVSDHRSRAGRSPQHRSEPHTPESLRALRKKPEANAPGEWERLQRILFASGIRVCPVSGAPVHNLDSCTEEWKQSLFKLLVALSEASNGKTGNVDAAMRAVASLLEADPSRSRC